MLAVSEKTDTLYYNKMFNSAACCNTAAAVDRELKSMNRNSSKLLSLKENIMTSVMVLGW